MNKIKVTCVEKYALLDQSFKFDFPVEYTEYQQLSQSEFYEKVHHQDVIILSDLSIDEKILDQNPDLKLVALCSTGYNHINVDLLKQRGVQVCNIRGQATDAVAEHAFTLMINLIKNFNQQITGVADGSWSNSNSGFCLAAPMRELKAKTLTIIGKGMIGSSLAQKAEAFGMNVIFSERKGASECREGYVAFDQAVSQADIISLHCKLDETTKGLIDRDVLQHMKKDSLLINVGRGQLVKDGDLIEALEKNLIVGYGTDVLDEEPPSIDHPLLKLNHPNVLITGHIAWATTEAQQRLFSMIEDNVNKNVQGTPQNLI